MELVNAHLWVQDSTDPRFPSARRLIIEPADPTLPCSVGGLLQVSMDPDRAVSVTHEGPLELDRHSRIDPGTAIRFHQVERRR